jgi:3-oxoadipate enol-lactonase
VDSLRFDDVGGGPVVVLIHGHPFDRRMWKPQLRSLSNEFRVIAPDLPGYGESPGRGSKLLMGELADSVIELLDRIDVARFTVVGLSMGGLVGMEIALAAPDRVAGLVLAASTAAPPTPADATARLALADAIERDGMLDVALDMAGKLFGPRARRNPDIVEPVLSMMLRASPAGAAAALRGRAERPDYTELLRGLRVPSMVIAGTEDPYADEAIVEQLIYALPDPSVVRLQGVGHMPNLEDPDGFDRAVRSFAGQA